MVQLTMQSNPSVNITVYAALDSMSSACFISRDVWMKVGCPGEPTEITIKTITDECRQNTTVVTGLCVSSVLSGRLINLPRVYTQDVLPISVDEIPSHSMLQRFPHLCHLVSEMPDRDESIPIGLIIGANCPKALQPQHVISSMDDGPFAVQTALGWCLLGPLQQNFHLDNISCSRIQAIEKPVCVRDTGVKEMMLQMYESDFSESLSKVSHHADEPAVCISLQQSDYAVSQDDRRFLALMESEAKLVDGHYHLPLPFRQLDVQMPNNRAQALHRAQGLERRFAADKKFHDDYTSFMNGMINKGHARKVPAKECDDKAVDSKLWYIPHHGVYHPRKPEKNSCSI